MAASACDEPPMHLQFFPWLMQQISSGKYLGLEWLDEDKKRLFKIPWTKKYYPQWEEHHEIFRAWALYRGRSDEGPKTLSQMKSNFRTILRKCVVIEEVQRAHQLGLQTGNYKVYRVLSEAEAQKKRVSQRKHKRKLPRHKLSEAASKNMKNISGIPKKTMDFASSQPPDPSVIPNTNHLVDTHDLQATEPALESKDDLYLCDVAQIEDVVSVENHQMADELQQSGQDQLANLLFEVKTEPPSTFSVGHKAKVISKALVPPTVSKKKACSQGKEDLVRLSERNDGMEKMHGFQMLLQAAELAEVSNPPSDESVEITDDDSFDLSSQTLHPSIVDVLVELKIPPEELFTYELHVKYETKCVLDSAHLDDMNYGYRIHYGCANETKFDLLRTHISEIPPDFERTPVVLPESKVPPGNSLYTVLKNMVAGLVVRSDKTYNLHCKRLCQARIFVFTDYGDVAANDEPMCLGRNQDTVLFSYKKFLSAWRQFLIEGSPRPNIEINLACGKKPKQRHNRVFVSMTLIPRAAKTMMQRISSVEDRSGADSSVDESSFDNILRLFYR